MLKYEYHRVNKIYIRMIVLILMVKNESAILARCLDAARLVIDAVCLCDTGSTDDTCTLARQWAVAANVPLVVYEDPWQNFGVNRSLSFKNAQSMVTATLGWDLGSTYGLLLDADMELRVFDVHALRRQTCTAPGFTVMQRSATLEYCNVRFVRMDVPWQCIGATHEFWSPGPDMPRVGPLPSSLVYIADIGDGGAKADKFTRDRALLEQGLAAEPDNARYMFYLARTYQDLNMHTDAVAMFKRRVAAGGWAEEVWCSMYRIACSYEQTHDWIRMEAWAQRAWEYRPARAESLYLLTRVFRERGAHFKAWHYMCAGAALHKPDDILFVETDVYTGAFMYEHTILAFYVQGPPAFRDNLKLSIAAFNRDTSASRRGVMYRNMQFYVQQLLGLHVVGALDVEHGLGDDFVASSCSFVPILHHRTRQWTREWLVNVRLVNYEIDAAGAYSMRENGVKSAAFPVRTENMAVVMSVNDDDSALSCVFPAHMTPDFCPARPTPPIIRGLEDIRLYTDDDGEEKWIASSVEFSDNPACIRIIHGTYDHDADKLRGGTVLQPPTHTQCEKNWVPLKNNRFIYRWAPFEIGVLDGPQLRIVSSMPMPAFWTHVRGSSGVVTYNGALYCLVHLVLGTSPRQYYHMCVRLDPVTFQPLATTLPFYFITKGIEYVLALWIDPCTGTAYTIVSQNDSKPVLVTFPIDAQTFEAI